MEIKLSKENQEILKKIKQIDKLATDIAKISETILKKTENDKKLRKQDAVERSLVGGIVLNTYSPIGEIGTTFRFGPNLIITGLLETIKEKKFTFPF